MDIPTRFLAERLSTYWAAFFLFSPYCYNPVSAILRFQPYQCLSFLKIRLPLGGVWICFGFYFDVASYRCCRCFIQYPTMTVGVLRVKPPAFVEVFAAYPSFTSGRMSPETPSPYLFPELEVDVPEGFGCHYMLVVVGPTSDLNRPGNPGD